MADLKKDFALAANRYDFFAAVSMLERNARSNIDNVDPLEDGSIRFVSGVSHAFPAADIAAVEHRGSSYRFILAFMGLCGVSSPLPSYFTECIDRQPEDGSAMRDFLDLFSHRMYVLFYRAWKKYRFENHHFFDKGIGFGDIARALAGLGFREPAGLPVAALGPMSSRCRSASGLQAVLEAAFRGVPARVVEWDSLRSTVENVAPVGNVRLGANALLGTTVARRSASFRIVLGPLPQGQLVNFLPGGAALARLCGIVQRFCTDALSFAIELKVLPSDLVPVVLGQLRGALGANSCLGKPAVSKSALPYANANAAMNDSMANETHHSIIIQPPTVSAGKVHHGFARRSGSP